MLTFLLPCSNTNITACVTGSILPQSQCQI